MKNCSFCKELKYGLKSINNSLYGKLYKVFGNKRIINETKSWVILPTVGCYIDGYTLAVNKAHYTSLYNCDTTSKKELEEIIYFMQKAYKEVYSKKIICFEHGTINNCYSSCSVEHTHIHFIPMQKSIWLDFLKEYNPTYYKINSINAMCKIINNEKWPSYLFLKDVDDQMYIISPDPIKYPSQFFRMYIHKKMNIYGDWDWNKACFIDNMWKTYTALSSHMNNKCTGF